VDDTAWLVGAARRDDFPEAGEVLDLFDGIPTTSLIETIVLLAGQLQAPDEVLAKSDGLLDHAARRLGSLEEHTARLEEDGVEARADGLTPRTEAKVEALVASVQSVQLRDAQHRVRQLEDLVMVLARDRPQCQYDLGAVTQENRHLRRIYKYSIAQIEEVNEFNKLNSVPKTQHDTKIRQRDAALADARRDHKEELARVQAAHEKELVALQWSARNTDDAEAAEALRRAEEEHQNAVDKLTTEHDMAMYTKQEEHEEEMARTNTKHDLEVKALEAAIKKKVDNAVRAAKQDHEKALSRERKDHETINSNIILADTNVDLRFEGLESRVTAAAGRLDDSMQAVGDRIGPMVSDGLEGVRAAIAVLMYTLCHQIDRGLVLQEAKTAALEQKIADGFGRLWPLGDSSAQETAAMFGLGLGMV
jgi:hypothetical protein